MSAKKIIEAKCNIKVKMLIQETSRTFMVEFNLILMILSDSKIKAIFLVCM